MSRRSRSPYRVGDYRLTRTGVEVWDGQRWRRPLEQHADPLPARARPHLRDRTVARSRRFVT